MANEYSDVDDYLNLLDETGRNTLSEIRALIRKTVPEAKESMKYKMPFYEYHGLLSAFAAQKNYYSFYLYKLTQDRCLQFWELLRIQ